MIVELKNESSGIKHFLETINELSNIDNSLDKEVEEFSQLIRNKYLNTQKKESENKNKWVKFAEKVHNENLLKGKSKKVVKMSQEFRKNFVF